MSLVVTAEKMAAGGDALAHLADGRVVFVTGALPGESVEVRLTQSRKDFAKAVVERVVEPSADRVEVTCAAALAGCGGCDWIHVAPEAQVRLKAEVVREALVRTGRLADPSVVIGGAVAPWGYRSTMRLAVAPSGRLGLRAGRSHDVVVLDGCPVADAGVAERIAEHREVAGRDEVTVRSADRLVIDDTSLRVSPESFSQSGPQAAALLIDTVDALLAGVPRHGTFLDAYGGVGLFAATVGRDFERVVLVESSHSACADARVNVPGAEVVDGLFEEWTPCPVDVAVVDPARAGLGRAGVKVVALTDAPVVALVSCDPVAGARDIALLSEAGYAHRRSVVLDLFPQTHHVEVVTLLERVRAS